MKTAINLWNIHYWLLRKNIPHLYSFEDELDSFTGIRFYTPETAVKDYALLFDEPDSHQYACVLTYRNSRIYFQAHRSAEAMNILNQIVSEYQQTLHKLRMMNLNRRPLTELLRAIYEYLNCPLMIIKNTHVITYTPNQDDLIYKVQDMLFNGDLASDFSRWLKSLDINSFTYPKIVHTNYPDPILLGRFTFQQNYIWILGIDTTHQMPCGNLNLFETALHAIYQNIMQAGSAFLENTIDDTESCFLAFVNQAIPYKSSIQHTMNKLHWNMDDIYTVYRIELFNFSDSLILNQIMCHLNKAFPKAYSMICGYGIYLFCNMSLSGGLITAEDFEKVLSLQYLYIGQSNIQHNFTLLPILIRQSQEAVSHGRKQNQHFLFAQEIFRDMLLTRLNNDRMLSSLIHPAIRQLILLDRDSSQKGYYFETLKCYLLCGANISSTAKKLNIHRNTLISRLDKIQTITHLDLSESDTLESLLQSILLSSPDSPAE